MAELKDVLRLKHGDTYSISCRGCHGLGYVSGKTQIVAFCAICQGSGRVELVKPKSEAK